MKNNIVCVNCSYEVIKLVQGIGAKEIGIVKREQRLGEIKNFASYALMIYCVDEVDKEADVEILKKIALYKRLDMLLFLDKDYDYYIEELAGVKGIDFILSPLNPKELVGRIKVKLAVTSRRNALKKKEKRLEHQLEETSTSLGIAQKQILNNEKMRAMGELSAGIFHEINTPLGFIASNYEVLQKYIESMIDFVQELKGRKSLNQKEIEDLFQSYDLDFITEDLGELMEDTDEGVQRVKKIISSLKNFSRKGEENKFELYQINDGVRNTLIIAKNEVKYIAEVALDLAEEMPEIYANGDQINQVLLNLIINASHALQDKYQDNGQMGLITIRTYYEGSDIFCEISDNGTGIKEENLKKIFELFFTTKPIGRGTGIGLNIAYDVITNKHQGEIHVESIWGEGTKFIIRLPIARV